MKKIILFVLLIGPIFAINAEDIPIIYIHGSQSSGSYSDGWNTWTIRDET